MLPSLADPNVRLLALVDLLVSFIYLLTGPSRLALSVYLWGFLGARTLHSVFYIRGIQPHRTIAFTVGAALLFVMLFRALVAVA